ncbi:MAG: cytochrome D1 domain-containing protein [Gemmatimonadota bacterium]|jgi:nitrite reductase (NO-forming)/hydroxylamine reductase
MVPKTGRPSVPILLACSCLALLSACGSEEGGGADTASVEAGRQVFTDNCVACHTIGKGGRIGPDLAGVTERRDRDWLLGWISNPQEMQEADTVAQRIAGQFQAAMVPLGLDSAEIGHVLDYIAAVSSGEVEPTDVEPVEVNDEPLTDEEFATARGIYFNRCAGCHGVLRTGATGPNIQPERTEELGYTILQSALTHGLPGGMPAWGESGVLSPEEIDLMVRYVQQPPPAPPERPLDVIRDSWDLRVPVADRPTAPETDRHWENFFGVILRDAGQVAILDGDTKELVRILDTGFAVHILRSSSSGRYFYAVGRDGRVTLIDLWTPEPTIAAQAQGCSDARSVDGSKFEGYEDRYLIQGCYWPPQYVVFDGLTLEPLTIHGVEGNAFDSGEPLDEVRVAAIVSSHHDPIWVLALKESGHVGIVDYSQEGFPLVSKIPAERFLHDGGFDHTGRYFMVAANMRNSMAVVDLETQELVTTFETGVKPHPGRGANWQDPEYGWVNATPHLGEGLLAVYGADPENHPEYAWRVVREIPVDGTGSLFVKTHPESEWVWVDTPLNNEPEDTRRICVYSKERAEIDRCWQAADHGAAVHFEYNRAGDEVWVSIWDREGEIVIYDDETLEEKGRITGDWLVTPTGKFNVWNTAHDVY